VGRPYLPKVPRETEEAGKKVERMKSTMAEKDLLFIRIIDFLECMNVVSC